MEEKVYKYKDTTANAKLFALTKRIRAIAGGTGASKTVGILIWLIDYAQSTKGKIISVVSESYPHLSLGAMREFKQIMLDRGYWRDDRWVGSPNPVYNFETGSIIEFISMDKLGKAHGPRRDVLFINEANNIEWAIADQLITRTKDVIWLDWNPSEEFWFYTEMKDRRDDVDFITLTFLDNEGLDEGQKQEILSHKDNLRWWKVYGLGELGEIEGRIFTGWQTIADIPHEAKLERYGLDFGYSNDPTAIVAVYYLNGGYILDEICFQKGLSNKQIADILINQPKALVVADSAEPKSIDEIKTYGVNIIPTTKGQGSVSQRIQMAQEERISVTKRSINLLKEYRNYMWEKDKNGRILNEPEHTWSHSMDAFMYALHSIRPVVQRRDFINNMPIFYQKDEPNPAR